MSNDDKPFMEPLTCLPGSACLKSRHVSSHFIPGSVRFGRDLRRRFCRGLADRLRQGAGPGEVPKQARPAGFHRLGLVRALHRATEARLFAPRFWRLRGQKPRAGGDRLPATEKTIRGIEKAK